jgi:hypothetical protein
VAVEEEAFQHKAWVEVVVEEMLEHLVQQVHLV